MVPEEGLIWSLDINNHSPGIHGISCLYLKSYSHERRVFNENKLEYL